MPKTHIVAPGWYRLTNVTYIPGDGGEKIEGRKGTITVFRNGGFSIDGMNEHHHREMIPHGGGADAWQIVSHDEGVVTLRTKDDGSMLTAKAEWYQDPPF